MRILIARSVSIIGKIGYDGERIMRGHAYIAPGGRHMELYRSGAMYFVKVRDGELVNRHRPSVDVLFNLVAKYAGQNAVGVLMTGMGRDDAQGLLNMRTSGALTLRRMKSRVFVFWMPKAAIELHAATYVTSLVDIPTKAMTLICSRAPLKA